MTCNGEWGVWFSIPFDTTTEIHLAPLELAVTFVTLGILLGSVQFWFDFVRKVRLGQAPVPWRFRYRPVHVSLFAVFLTLSILLISVVTVFQSPNLDLSELSIQQIHRGVSFSIIESIMTTILLGIAVLVDGTLHSQTTLIRLGFRCDDVPGQVKEGGLGFLASVLPVALAILLTLPLRGEETMHPYLRLLHESASASTFGLIFLAAVILAPLKEELMFRVILQNWLEKYSSPTMAVLLSSLIFSFVHGVPDSLALFPLAVVLGVLYQRRRSYLSVVTTHALFNAYNTVAVLGS